MIEMNCESFLLSPQCSQTFSWLAPSSAGQLAEYLPSYEEMTLDEMFNGPSSMETQPDLAPVQVLEEGVAVTQDGQTVEWWPMEMAETELMEYLIDESHPLHTNFVLPNQGKR